jgi:hypothetical protein
MAPCPRDRVACRAGPAMPDAGRRALAGMGDYTAHGTGPSHGPDARRQPTLGGLDLGFQGGRYLDEMAATKANKKNKQD